MTLQKRLQLGMSILACSAAIAASAHAAPPQALSTTDAQRYALAFDAADRGDFIDAEMKVAEIKDKSLLGYLSFTQLMHPTAHKASFDELATWMTKFRDLPLAERVFALASKRKPDETAKLPTPVVTVADAGAADAPAAAAGSSERARQAREAFYSGDAKRALQLAPAAGERWIAGLAAYRLKSYDEAQTHFAKLAGDESADVWIRSAAAFWAGRSAGAIGDAATAASYLRLAASSPNTFYGMIAERQIRLASAPVKTVVGGAASDMLTKASFSRDDVGGFLKAEPRAHRAAALAQIGRAQEAGQELRAGLATAKSETDRKRWTALMDVLGGPARIPAALAPATRAADYDYPTPLLEPKSGFTIDKALVYAIVRQESRFNPMAMSPVGAVGLMQLMPEAAARAAGDDKLKVDMSPLLDPAFNLRVGQDYVTWLMERGVGYDILRTVAAYNGGPGTLLKTAQMVGDDADSLLIIECLPALETRNYVEKVMAAYWTYKRMWGEDPKTLDAVAAGARFVDARLDLPETGGATTQLSAKPLQIGMR